MSRILGLVGKWTANSSARHHCSIACPMAVACSVATCLVFLVAARGECAGRESDPCNLACPSDLDFNGLVTGADLGLLLAEWRSEGSCADINDDGTVDEADLAALLADWGACAGEPCTEFAWLTGFGVGPDPNGKVRAFVVFDDGTGPALYVGGEFTSIGGVVANGIARWDGYTWSDVGGGVAGGAFGTGVSALAVFDDGRGTGPVLATGGSFTTAGGVPANNIALWNGTTWAPLGSGTGGGIASSAVGALTVFDDGSGAGPALYAGGPFKSAGGVLVNHIARWNGSAWSALGTGMSGTGATVLALAAFDDGDGPALYAGGVFTTSGGVATNHIARWNGASWSALGSGMSGEFLSTFVRTLLVHDDQRGAGPALFAGGAFTKAAGITCNGIARWNGSAWSALSSGVGDGNLTAVHALAEYAGQRADDLSLYACGDFTSAGGVPASNIARWDGSAWSAVGTGITGGAPPSVDALGRFDRGDGEGEALYVGGTFTSAGGVGTTNIASWDGVAWSAIGTDTNGIDASVNALAARDDERAESSLYAGGIFTHAGGVLVNRVARWDGSAWTALGSGANSTVEALAVAHEGDKLAVYAGGSFTVMGGLAANRVARWNGLSWETLGSGMNQVVHALAPFDGDGVRGVELYAGGNFTNAGGVGANRIARWDGAVWSPLGSGLNLSVRSLAVFDDGGGGGPALYAGGDFTTAGGTGAMRIARWSGSSWSNLSSGMNSSVLALAVFDDGRGPALYAAGSFTSAGGVPANRIARWDGVTWSAVGTGTNNSIFALAVFDDGRTEGAALYAAGVFTTAGGIAANRIARWDGRSWSALDGGANEAVNALAAFHEGIAGQPALFAGGAFTMVGDVASSGIAQWSCASPEDLSRP